MKDTLHIMYLKIQGVAASVLAIFLSFAQDKIYSFMSGKIMLVVPGSRLDTIEEILHLVIMLLTIASLIYSIRLSIVNHKKIKGEN